MQGNMSLSVCACVKTHFVGISVLVTELAILIAYAYLKGCIRKRERECVGGGAGKGEGGRERTSVRLRLWECFHTTS